MNIVFYGDRYYNESGGALAMYYDELTGEPVSFNDIGVALVAGEEVHIRPATVADTHQIEAALAICKAQQSASLSALVQEWTQ